MYISISMYICIYRYIQIYINTHPGRGGHPRWEHSRAARMVSTRPMHSNVLSIPYPRVVGLGFGV